MHQRESSHVTRVARGGRIRCLLCACSGSSQAACIVRSSQKHRPLRHSLRTLQAPRNHHAPFVASLASSSDRFGICDRITSWCNDSFYLNYPGLQRSRLPRVSRPRVHSSHLSCRNWNRQNHSQHAPQLLYGHARLCIRRFQCRIYDGHERRFFRHSNHAHNWRCADRYHSRDRYAVRLDPGSSSCKPRSL